MQVHTRPSASMQIGEAAKLSALTVDAIRFDERRALLPKAPGTAGRFRLYTADDVARLDFIRQMQDLGFLTTRVRQLLDLRERRLDTCHEVRDLLKMKLATVRSKIRELGQLDRELAADLRKCNHQLKHRQKHTPRSCPVLAASKWKESNLTC